MNLDRPELIPGGTHADARGVVSYVNTFAMDAVKRFYHIHHKSTDVVRAWQAHRVEQKWFYVLEGSFHILLVNIDDWNEPAVNPEVLKYEVNGLTGVLHVPAGFANGFKAKTPNAKMIIFSDASIEESNNDNYRFDQDLWVDWNKI